jgi:hypothetical protein
MSRIECRECGALNTYHETQCVGNDNQPLIDSGRPFVLAVAGGGSEVFGDFLRHGGMSGTMLLGYVLQSTDATDLFLGHKPEAYASAETARRLAMVAYRDALRLTKEPGAFGVGATSSLRKPDGERDGRLHRAFVAYQRDDQTLVLSAVLNETRTREEEEAEVARLIEVVVWWGARLWTATTPAYRDEIGVAHATGYAEWSAVVHGNASCTPGERGSIVLSSSLNPIHDTHVAMMRWAYEATGIPVDLELCVRNADKPPLDYIDIQGRISSTQARLEGEDSWSGRIHLTDTGLFSEKSKIFPGAVFLVGSDTIRRVADPGFYEDEAVMWMHMGSIYKAACSFLVFNRTGSDLTREDLPMPVRDLVCFAGPSYLVNNASSTALRRSS